MATTSDLSRGAFIRFNNELAIVLEYEHKTPNKTRALYQVKMRNVRTGKLIEHRFRAGESIELVRVEAKEMQYLYQEGQNFIFMDNETFEQVSVESHLLGDNHKFLKEGMTATVSFDDMVPVMVELPFFVELEVSYTEPGIKGDTATKTLKPATLETGAEINIPLFVDSGELIKVDTRTGVYVERVKK